MEKLQKLITPDFTPLNIATKSHSAKTLTEWTLVAFQLAGGKLPQSEEENLMFKPMMLSPKLMSTISNTNMFSPKLSTFSTSTISGNFMASRITNRNKNKSIDNFGIDSATKKWKTTLSYNMNYINL